jgi:hypothetical protein
MHGHNPVLQRDSRVVNPTILVLLVCADVAFFALHSFNRLSRSRNDLFSLSVDGGYAEVFQYLKEYWITLALFTAWWRAREGVYAAWALLFTYLLLDDALTIHETAGKVVLAFFGVGLDMVHGVLEALGVRALTIVEDGGEMLAMSIIASYVVPLVEQQGHAAGFLWRSTVAALTSHAHRDRR